MSTGWSCNWEVLCSVWSVKWGVKFVILCWWILCFRAWTCYHILSSRGAVINRIFFCTVRRVGFEPDPLYVTTGTKHVFMTVWNWLLDTFIHFEILNLRTSVMNVFCRRLFCYFPQKDDRLLGDGRGGDRGLWCPSNGARSIFAFIRNSVCVWEIRTEGYHRRPVASVA